MSACVCQGSVTHGCHSWVLWQCHLHSRHVLFYVSLRLRVCSSRALSHLRALFRVEVWCLDPGTFGFMLGFGHSHSMCPSVSFWEHAVSSSLSRVLFCPPVLCFVLLHAVHVLSAAWIHVISCAVWHAACFFHGLPAFMLSCLVWTCGLWVFSLAACLCPVLHNVLSCQFVLTPPILFPDYWLICPTCLSSLPSSFAPFIISLCLQSCASSSLNFSCLLPCQAVLFSPMGGFVCLFVLFKFLQIKSHLLHHWVLASSLHPQPWQCRLALSNFCSDCLRWQPWIIYLYLYKYYYYYFFF